MVVVSLLELHRFELLPLRILCLGVMLLLEWSVCVVFLLLPPPVVLRISGRNVRMPSGHDSCPLSRRMQTAGRGGFLRVKYGGSLW